MIDINKFTGGWQLRSSDNCELLYLPMACGWTQGMVDQVARVAEEYASGQYEDGYEEGTHATSKQAETDRQLLEELVDWKFENGEVYDLTDPDEIKRLYDLAYPKAAI